MSTTTKRDQDRPTFIYNGQPVRAAGLLAYVTIEGRKHYLLRSEKRGRWSDIGGKTDAMDEDIISVVVREVTEETNNHLFSEGAQLRTGLPILERVVEKRRVGDSLLSQR